MKFSLQHKLFFSFMALAVLVLFAAMLGASFLIRDYLLTSKEQDLTRKAAEINRMVQAYYDGYISHEQLANFVNSVDSLLDARVWVVNQQGSLIMVSEEQASPETGRPNTKPSPMRPPWGGSGHGSMGYRPWMHDYCNPSMAPIPPPSSGGHGHGGNRSNSVTPPAAPSPPLVLDMGKSQNPGQEISVPSFADIQGMAPIWEMVRQKFGRSWSLTYTPPYYNESMLIVAIPLMQSDGQPTGTIMLLTPFSGITGFLHQMYYYTGYGAIAAILLAAFLAIIIARSIVKPLQAMEKAAAAMARGDYTQHISISGQDEVADLGRSLNSLSHDLHEYVTRMETTDTMRREFVANVSHELRTPLTVIRGYNQALWDGTVTDNTTRQSYHQVVDSEIIRLEHLINDLLELSQLQARGIPLDKEPVSLSEIADNVITLLTPRSREKNIRLTASVTPRIPAVLGDGNRLTQLFLILTDNSLKFTPDGGEVSISLQPYKGGVQIEVCDTGDGIPTEDLPHIWERFYKADKSRSSEGTGLGLAIAKEIIDLHGASVTVTSSARGTCFIISFPRETIFMESRLK